MSLILDAIKKSERERQQQEVPGLAANHNEYQSGTPDRNWWRLIFGLVLLIAAIVYFINFQPDFISEQPNNVETPSSVNNTKDTTLEKSQESTFVQVESKPSVVVKKLVPSPEVIAAIAIEPVTVKTKVINLDSNLRESLPAINFSSHVYTGNSATSFVVLNDEFFGVGEKFNEDLKIIQINKDGMVILFEEQQIFIKALENITP